MLTANELLNRGTDILVHTSQIGGKVRMATFYAEATAADTSRKVLIGYLPAGRGRAIPQLSRIATLNYAGTYTIGLGAYRNIDGADVAEDEDALSSAITAADGTAKTFVGSCAGVAYQSSQDIPVYIFTSADLADDDIFTGMLVFSDT